MAVKTKAPTGLTISRSGNSFKCSWKCGDKNYSNGQSFRYSLTGMKSPAWLAVGAGVRSKAVTINANNYYPRTSKYLKTVKFEVRGNCGRYKKKKKWVDPRVSSWAGKAMTLTIPARPTVTEKLDDTLSSTTVFSWETVVSDTNTAWFTDVEWESMLVKDNNETNGSKLAWSSSALGYQTGTGGASGSKEITESTGITALASFTRWFRVRSRGPAGASAWTYIKHVYAKPNGAVITKAEATPQQNGYLAEVYWTLALPNARPVDKTIVQYQIATPADMLTRPEENSWVDANVSRDIRYDAENSNSAALFNVDGLMGLDKCLFIRVNTQHDTEANTTLGDPALAYIGRLTAPKQLSVTLNHTSHKATITATNDSAVTDSFMVVRYIPASDPEGFVVGVMTESGSITVQCPDWSHETGYRFEVYTAVGTYSETVRADGVSSYEVNALMVSDSVNNGGVVPLPPENVSVSATSIPGTARVVWDWTWAEATGAEISWADHADAWESTDEPEVYEVGAVNASAWNISGLETGVTWYIRVRLIQKVGDTEVASAWSDMKSISLASAPSVPVLTLSAGVITADGSVTASWVYSTTDGTAQSHATIAELTYEDGEPVYTKLAETETEQHITISAEVAGWQTGESHSLVVQVMSASGRLSDGWSDPVAVIVADPLTADITETSLINADIEVNPRTFTGNPIQFNTDLEETVTDMEVTLNPIQDLSHGAPSPENICPISGWDSVDVSVCGINVWDEEWESGGISNTTGQNAGNANTIRAKNYIPIHPNTTYFVKAPINVRAYWYDLNRNYISTVSIGSASPFTTPNDAHYMRFIVGNSANPVTTYNNDISINYPSTDHDYHAYNGQTYTQDIEATYTPTVQENEPYQFKRTGDVGGDRESIELVGGTVAWNQLVNKKTETNAVTDTANALRLVLREYGSPYANYVTKNFSQAGNIRTVFKATGNSNGGVIFKHNGSTHDFFYWGDTTGNFNILANHVYLFSADVLGADITTIGGATVDNVMLFDLTAMFCSTIADYIYSLEQSQAGAGVAWFRNYFSKDYYPYDKGTLRSVEGVSAHETVGFNAWDEEWEVGAYSNANGNKITVSNRIRSKNYIPILPSTTYYGQYGGSGGLYAWFYDENKTFTGDVVNITRTTFTTPNNARYMNIATYNAGSETYKNDICINLSDPTRNGEYEPYQKHTYPLDSSLTLRGVPKLVDGKLAFDGDVYPPSGEVQRRYGLRAYQSGDESLTDAITDGTNTVYKLTTPTTETADGYEQYQRCDPSGTEEFVTTGIVPVGHNTTYLTRDIFGGTLDLVSGVLTVDRAMVDLGTLNWTYYSAQARFRTTGLQGTIKSASSNSSASGVNAICSQYALTSYNGTASDNGAFGISTDGALCIKDTDYTDATDFQTAMNGVQLCYELAEPRTIQLTPQTISTLVGVNNVWGDGDIEIRIAEMVEHNANVLDKMPLTVTVTGADVGDTTSLIIERSADFQIEQPNEKTLNGYEGEAIVVQSMNGSGTFTIDNTDLIGRFNDGASYRIIATVQDGLGQSATADIITFLVRWAHQALIPNGEVSADTDHMVTIITPIAPAGTEDGDTCDIYRLSVDRPALIYEGAKFGEQYVDPFPTIGENGGHRIVFKSKDGDYITADETMAWTDFGEDDDDFLPNGSTIIDFGTGRVNLDYDLDLSSDWSKDVEVTNYLGGSVQGDWNPAINRSGKVSAIVPLTDVDTIEGMRRLADYPGICHVRTNEGSSYAADVQVSEGVSADSGHKVASFDISITKVDPESLDGLTYAEWLATQEEEA